jgi:hypothetical protein
MIGALNVVPLDFSVTKFRTSVGTYRVHHRDPVIVCFEECMFFAFDFNSLEVETLRKT